MRENAAGDASTTPGASDEVSASYDAHPKKSRRLRSQRHEFQQHLFPKHPVRRLGLDIAGRSVPANAAGGDYFDFIDKAGDHVDVVIGDVSGHGAGPALLTAATRAYVSVYAPNCTTRGELEKVNRVLCQDIVGEQFVTLSMVRIAADGSSYVFANAGHNPGFVLASRGELKQQPEVTGLPLGIAEDVEYSTSPVMRTDAVDIMLL